MIIASLSEGWDDAEPMLKEAIDILRKLNVGAWENDSYPIVSLAEGHISILLRFLGTEAAQRVAQQYANELLVVYKRNPSPRLEEAVNNVVTFATSGTWKEAYGPDYGDEI